MFILRHNISQIMCHTLKEFPIMQLNVILSPFQFKYGYDFYFFLYIVFFSILRSHMTALRTQDLENSRQF